MWNSGERFDASLSLKFNMFPPVVKTSGPNAICCEELEQHRHWHSELPVRKGSLLDCIKLCLEDRPCPLWPQGGVAVHYLRYSYMSASSDTRPKYDSTLRSERVRLITAISDLHRSPTINSCCSVTKIEIFTALVTQMSSYLNASSNLRLSHVVLTQRNTQSRGRSPAFSAWIFPQPRTALKQRYVCEATFLKAKG